MSVEELTKEQVQMLRKAFDMFDREKRGCIHTNMVSTILRTLGQSFEEKELQVLIKEIDADGKYFKFIYRSNSNHNYNSWY